MRDLVSGVIQSQKVAVNKEQLDLFCLRVLATACVSVSNAASRTAVLMAFGKANLVSLIFLPCDLVFFLVSFTSTHYFLCLHIECSISLAAGAIVYLLN